MNVLERWNERQTRDFDICFDIIPMQTFHLCVCCNKIELLYALIQINRIEWTNEWMNERRAEWKRIKMK